jgi:osmotically-inducible protein OsmY
MRQFLDDGRIEFGPAQSDDAQLRAEIVSCLARSPWLDARGVEVHVFGGQVRLEGSKTARAIEEIAQRCEGVRGVDERLRVARPGRQR